MDGLVKRVTSGRCVPANRALWTEKLRGTLAALGRHLPNIPLLQKVHHDIFLTVLTLIDNMVKKKENIKGIMINYKLKIEASFLKDNFFLK